MAAADPAAAEHRSRHMASTVHVIAFGPDDVVARAGAIVDRRLAELERSWSRFRADSAVSRLNAAGGRWVDVDADTVTLLAVMRLAAELTDGACDATVLPALLAAGYTHSVVDGRRAPATSSGASAAPAPGLDGLEADAVTGRARLVPGVAIDPGALGKGLAADLAAGELLAAGATAALVGIGGDLRAMGTPPSGSWTILVEHPDEPGTTVSALSLDAGGVATSTTTARRLVADGRTTSHVIDPRTGTPAVTDLASATVVAPTAWQAEALATAALVSGAAAAHELLCTTGTPAVLFTASGARLTTPDLIETELEDVR